MDGRGGFGGEERVVKGGIERGEGEEGEEGKKKKRGSPRRGSTDPVGDGGALLGDGAAPREGSAKCSDGGAWARGIGNRTFLARALA